MTINASSMAEDLARRIRVQLGEFNDDNLAVTTLVRDLADFKRAHLAQPAQAVDVGADEWVEALAMPEGYELDEHLPGIWEYEYDREDGERMASATSWNHPALAAIAAWQEYTRALSGEKAGLVGDGKPRAFALHAAVGAIYFADSSDYLSALWEVVRELAPDLVDELAANPSAIWHRTMAEADQFTLPASPTPGKEGA